jgi:Flp pilus assembly pilin Flp
VKQFIRRVRRVRPLLERGASLVEYGLLLALIAIVALVATQAFGEGVGDKMSKNASRITNAGQ